jgi:hypothetical protein
MAGKRLNGEVDHNQKEGSLKVHDCRATRSMRVTADGKNPVSAPQATVMPSRPIGDSPERGPLLSAVLDCGRLSR